MFENARKPKSCCFIGSAAWYQEFRSLSFAETISKGSALVLFRARQSRGHFVAPFLVVRFRLERRGFVFVSFASMKYSNAERRNRTARPIRTQAKSPLAVRLSTVRKATPSSAAACVRLSRIESLTCIRMHRSKARRVSR